MHVLYVIDSLVPAGAERSLADLAPKYEATGIKLDVAYLDPRPGLQGELSKAGARLFAVGQARGRVYQIRHLRRLISELGPDLVHTTLFEADVLGRTAATLARVPVVSSLVNVAYGPEQLSDPRLRRWKVRAGQMIDAITSRRVARFHAITRHVADVMGRRLRISPERIDVIPRGRDHERLGRRTPERRRLARESLNVFGEEPLVLAAARHERQKGLDVLLEAFPEVLQQFPTTRLFIAGREGNETTRLRAITSKLRLDDRVSILGIREDLSELLCAADLLCLPSRWEGLGGVLLEAMALEAPIVASNLPAIREVVQGEANALLIPPGDSVRLAEAILATLTSPEHRAQRAQRARHRFLRQYTMEKVAKEMVAFYDRALRGR